MKQQDIFAAIRSKSVRITLMLIWLLGSTLFVFSATTTAGKDTNIVGPNSVHNDDFDFADVLPEPPTNGLANQILQDTTDATVAPDDPDMGCGAGVNSKTVWFKITPSYRGRLRVRTYSTMSSDGNSNYDTVLAVFTGHRGALQWIACNDDVAGHEPLSELTFQTEVDKVYYIEVAGYGTNSPGGTLSLFINYDSVETQVYCGQWRWINCGGDTWPAFFPTGSSQPWIPLVPVPGYPFPDPIGQYWRVWDPRFGGTFGSCPPYQDPIWVTDLSNHEVVSSCAAASKVYIPFVFQAWAPTPPPTTPTIRVEPTAGPPGTRFYIYGSGFIPGESVQQWVIMPNGDRFDDPTPNTVDGQGNYTSWVQIPGPFAPTGIYTLYARGNRSQVTVSTRFRVTEGRGKPRSEEGHLIWGQ